MIQVKIHSSPQGDVTMFGKLTQYKQLITKIVFSTSIFSPYHTENLLAKTQ